MPRPQPCQKCRCLTAVRVQIVETTWADVVEIDPYTGDKLVTGMIESENRVLWCMGCVADYLPIAHGLG